MKNSILIFCIFVTILSHGQDDSKKALRLQYQFDERKPKIIFPGETIIYRSTKDHKRHEVKIREVTDSSLIFTDFSEVKFSQLKVIRKHSSFKEILGIGFAGGSALILGGLALTITGANNHLGGLVALGIVMMSLGTPVAGATGYPFFAIKTRYDLKKEYKASSVTAHELLQKKEKVTEL